MCRQGAGDLLSDSGELRTRFGTYLLAAGAVGEFGLTMLVTLFLSSQSVFKARAILIGFVAAAFGVAILPLVLAITTLARDTGHMRASTAAALLGAAVQSTMVFPVLGLRVRGDLRLDDEVEAEDRVVTPAQVV